MLIFEQNNRSIAGVSQELAQAWNRRDESE
jgi:hypothetical protein